MFVLSPFSGQFSQPTLKDNRPTSTVSALTDRNCHIVFFLQLLEDPIFIPINQLEQGKKNQPEEFSVVEKAMRAGKQGFLRIKKASGGKPRVR